MAKTAGRRMATINANKRGSTPVDNEIAVRIRARRLEVGMSQDTLGMQLGLSFQQIQKYEKGKNRIACVRLLQIADILGVDYTYFLKDLNVNGNGKGKGKVPVTKSRFADFMATPDFIDINDAMLKLGAAHRRNVIELARVLVKAYGE